MRTSAAIAALCLAAACSRSGGIPQVFGGFSASLPASAQAGEPVELSIAAVDARGAAVKSFRGTVGIAVSALR